MLRRCLPFWLSRRTSFILLSAIFAAYYLISYGILFQETSPEDLPTSYPFQTPIQRQHLMPYPPSKAPLVIPDFTEQSEEDVFVCPAVSSFAADIDVNNVYPSLEFEVDFEAHKTGYWSPQREESYQKVKNTTTPGLYFNSSSNPLKVIVVPHSHTDPGWLKTFELYFQHEVFQILDNIVTKLPEMESMTFIWSEISFLDRWWKMAEPSKRAIFKNLVASGRLEITTGGWVMTDEATVSLYPMIDQLIEGHQWIHANLGIVPVSSWSVDPFGHGSTFPYILHSSAITSMTIGRFHFAWKKWFGDKRRGDFAWTPRWDSNGKYPIHCHSSPWDIYAIEYSCGPSPLVCRQFDFSDKRNPQITSENVKDYAEALLEQYRKTGSLFPHNVALIPFGDDFRFSVPDEWDRQYSNLKKLFDFITARKDVYNAEVAFGTLSDYFEAVREREYKWPSLSGDFFVYSDIFTNSRPGHWSGFFGTRPAWKKFYRETENVLRGAEILFTIANAVTSGVGREIVTIMYEQLVSARRDLALFAHHDATTGTSLPPVMADYGERLTDAWKKGTAIQMTALTPLLFGNISVSPLGKAFVKESFEKPAVPVPLDRFPKKVVLYNSLGHRRSHLAKIQVTSIDLQVVGPYGELLVAQISPVIIERRGKRHFSKVFFELAWIAELEPMSVSVFEVRPTLANSTMTTLRSTVFCQTCTNVPLEFQVREMPPWDIRLENRRIKVTFDRDTGHVMRIRRLVSGMEDDEGDDIRVELNLGSYFVVGGQNGAYLLKVETSKLAKSQIPFEDEPKMLFVVDGVLFSEVNFAQKPVNLVTRLMHTGGKIMEEQLFIETHVNLARSEFRGEMFIRLTSDIDNFAVVNEERVPTFFTDQNGFTFEQRTKFSKLNYEENVYPVNTMVYIQDNIQRLTLVVDRSQGCHSSEFGRIECLVERRTEREDGRGLGQGVMDNKPVLSKYILSLEDFDDLQHGYQSNLPTLQTQRSSLELSYPPTMFYFDDQAKENSGVVKILNQELPCDAHLINLRTLTDTTKVSNGSTDTPSGTSLLIAQRLGFRCTTQVTKELNCRLRNDDKLFHTGTHFTQLKMSHLETTGITGVQMSSGQTRQDLTALQDLIARPFEIASAVIHTKYKNKQKFVSLL